MIKLALQCECDCLWWWSWRGATCTIILFWKFRSFTSPLMFWILQSSDPVVKHLCVRGRDRRWRGCISTLIINQTSSSSSAGNVRLRRWLIDVLGVFRRLKNLLPTYSHCFYWVTLTHSCWDLLGPRGLIVVWSTAWELLALMGRTSEIRTIFTTAIAIK